MTREIKFRAWEGRHKKMHENVGFLNGIIYLPNGKKLTTTKTLMQYTGLKDKNGVEIYEGDIVELINNDEQKKMGDAGHMEGIMEVWFNPKALGFQGRNYTPLDWLGTKSIEVLGNIYQNPELIKNHE